MSAEHLITEHLDLWTSAVTYNNGKGRGNNGEPELTGIDKLRELILELAVRGKLVLQDPADEPASKLLERIEGEKARLYKEGKIRKPKKLPEVDQSEKRFELPLGWQWTRLGALFNSIKSGGTPSKSNPAFWGGDIPWASVKDLGAFTDLSDTQDHITQEGLQAGSTLADEGDILICTRMGLGKVAVCKRPVAFNQDLKAIKINSELSESYFLLAFSALEITGTGTTVAGITQNRLLNYVIALPPKEEQDRIVEKVDELMALCDRLEQQTSDQLSAHETLVDTLLDTLTRSQDAAELAENWARLAAHFDTLFTTEHSIDRLEQTILQLAVMGRLVPQDPNDEPASKLLERIAAEKKGKDSKKDKGDKYKNASDKPKPYQLPSGWEWCHFADIGDLSRGKSKHRPRNDPWLFKDGFMPLVQTGDVAKPGRKIETFTYLYNENGVEQSLVWPQGTLCITIAANIGETGILDFEACFPDSVVGFIPFESGIKNEYIEYFLRTAQKSLEDFAPATAQKNINLEILQDLLIPLPPVSELNRIIERVDELIALCDRLKSQLSEVGETQQWVAENIVKQAVA
jgi:type I restriction enzyme S subunit